MLHRQNNHQDRYNSHQNERVSHHGTYDGHIDDLVIHQNRHNNHQNRYNHRHKQEMIQELMEYNNTDLVNTLWKCDPEIFKIFTSSDNTHNARDKLFNHLNDIEKHIFNIYSDMHFKNKNILERNNAKECIRVFKNILR